MACRFMLPKWIAAHGRWAATALNGHINFHTVSTPAVQAPHTSQGSLHANHQGSAISDCGQDQSSSPKPSSTAVVVKQTGAEQSGSGRGLAEDEEGQAPVGGSPTSQFADMWRGPALNSSLKQAIAEKPASISAQPINLEDNDPAKQHPLKPAHQQATLPVTSTNPAHPNTPALPKTAFRTPRAQAATSHTGVGNDTTVAMGANKQKPPVEKQPGGSPAAAVVAQGTATRAGASSGTVAPQGTAARAGTGSGDITAQGTATRAGARSGAIAAQAEAETTADRNSGDVSTAGRVQRSSGHSQDHGRPARHLDIRMVPAGPELVDVEYPLYHKYQISNHHDKPSKVNGM